MVEPVTGYPVFIQSWDESERGWGIRPDGASLHLSEEDCKAYIAEHNARLPKEVPHEYSRPGGRCKKILVNKEGYDRVASSKGRGLRLWQSEKHKFIKEHVIYE